MLGAFFDSFEQTDTFLARLQDMVPNKNRLRRIRIQIDATACLLQRREARAPTVERHIRGLRADASPKMSAEIMAMEVDSISFSERCGELVLQRGTEWLPGSTLSHGCARVPHKIYSLLWGLHLTFGPGREQLRKALLSFRWLVTDMGSEHCIADAADCLDAFYETWCNIAPEDRSAAVSEGKYLFPLLMYVPGWSHLWSNIVKEIGGSLGLVESSCLQVSSVNSPCPEKALQCFLLDAQI